MTGSGEQPAAPTKSLGQLSSIVVALALGVLGGGGGATALGGNQAAAVQELRAVILEKLNAIHARLKAIETVEDDLRGHERQPGHPILVERMRVMEARLTKLEEEK